jgi:hypothetical protein
MTNESFEQRIQRIHAARPDETCGPQISAAITIDFVMKKMLLAAGVGIFMFSAVIASADYIPLI